MSEEDLMVENERLKAELAKAQAENEALRRKRAKAPGISLKVSSKGALSVYGLGRFPVTLYKEQWKKLLDMSDPIRAFIAEHDVELKAKDAAAAPPEEPPAPSE